MGRGGDGGGQGENSTSEKKNFAHFESPERRGARKHHALGERIAARFLSSGKKGLIEEIAVEFGEVRRNLSIVPPF